MQAFDYSAVDAAGKKVRGSLSAESERQVRRQLRDMQLFPEKIVAVQQKSGGKSGAWRDRFNNRLGSFELALILRQLGILVKSGLPLDSALKMLVEQAENRRQRRLVESIRSSINEGRSMSAALQNSSFNIPESVVASIGVGEETGHLHSVMIRLADELEHSAENRQSFNRALIYPAALVITAVVVVAILMVWVVPKITTVFVSARQELPLITQVVVAVSDFMRSYGFYGLVLVAGGLLLGHYLLRDPERRYRWHRFLLSLPGVGRWMRMAAIADWSRSLGTLLASGVPAMGALRISSSVVANLYMRGKFEAVTEQMRRGSSLHAALSEVDVGSAFLLHMVGSGEASSELDTMLQRVADYYGNRLDASIETFLKLLNPALIVLLGLVVLVIVAAVMLPILEMNEMV